MKRVPRCGGCCLLPVLLVGAAGLLWFNQQLQPAANTPRAISVVIPSGATPRTIARFLHRQGVIRSDLGFLWTAFRRGKLAALKSGRYQLSPDMSLSAIVDRLSRGGQDVNEIAVTIPEGFTLRQIGAALEAKGVIDDRAAFYRLKPDILKEMRLPFSVKGKSLEGYLYPDTYRFQRRIPPQQAARTMVVDFSRRFFEPNREAIKTSGSSLEQIVTIASLVEREAETPGDRPRIAGVIMNRLRKGMRLEIDATVLYALGYHKDRLLYRDLSVDSPYNTYRNPGLPPGPIASPGYQSLVSAIHPEANDYLYYVASPDGSHLFSRTLAEHNRNVAHMRALRRAAR